MKAFFNLASTRGNKLVYFKIQSAGFSWWKSAQIRNLTLIRSAEVGNAEALNSLFSQNALIRLPGGSSENPLYMAALSMALEQSKSVPSDERISEWFRVLFLLCKIYSPLEKSIPLIMGPKLYSRESTFDRVIMGVPLERSGRSGHSNRFFSEEALITLLSQVSREDLSSYRAEDGLTLWELSLQSGNKVAAQYLAKYR
jgi:hypothetical protein